MVCLLCCGLCCAVLWLVPSATVCYASVVCFQKLCRAMLHCAIHAPDGFKVTCCDLHCPTLCGCQIVCCGMLFYAMLSPFAMLSNRMLIVPAQRRNSRLQLLQVAALHQEGALLTKPSRRSPASCPAARGSPLILLHLQTTAASPLHPLSLPCPCKQHIR